uniref:Uncharacterized protein n=1 Tax=Anolis carolinensis TaxID=28377 RepID=A0A803TK35_ANOCA
MASWCRRCRKRVCENPPFSIVRISEGEMKSYYNFLRECTKLARMALLYLDDSIIWQYGGDCPIISIEANHFLWSLSKYDSRHGR